MDQLAPVQGDGVRNPAQSVIAPRTEFMGAGVRAGITRKQGTVRESIDAALQEYDTVKLVKKAFEPSFASDPYFNFNEAVQQARTALQPDEYAYLRDKSNSLEAFTYHLEKIKASKENQQLMADHPLASMLAGFADPVYIAADAATLGTAKALRMGRLGAAATSTVGTVGIMNAANDYGIDSSDLAVAALMNAGLVLALHRTPKDKPKVDDGKGAEPDNVKGESESIAEIHKEYTEISKPDRVLVKTEKGKLEEALPDTEVQPLKGSNTKQVDIDPPKTELKPDTTSTQPKESKPRPLGELVDFINKTHTVTNNPLLIPFWNRLQKPLSQIAETTRFKFADIDGPSYYDPNTDTIVLRSNLNEGLPKGMSPMQVMVHEMVHALTVRKLALGKIQQHTELSRIYDELDQLRRLAKKAAKNKRGVTLTYGLKSPEEFVAELLSGQKPFIEHLASVPYKNLGLENNVLHRLIHLVKQVLGLKDVHDTVLARSLAISERLLDLPLIDRDMLKAYTKGDVAKGELPVYHSPSTPEAKAAITSRISKALDSMWDTVKDKSELAKTLSWNWHKTMSKYSPEIADMLLSDPLDQSKTSAAHIKRTYEAELTAIRMRFNDMYADLMAERGIKWYNRILNTQEARAVQRKIDNEVAAVLNEWEQAGRENRNIPYIKGDPIHELARVHQEFYDKAVDIANGAGVYGAETLEKKPGYYSRRFDANRFQDVDSIYRDYDPNNPTAGRQLFAEQFAQHIRTADGDPETSYWLAYTMLDRARRRADMADESFQGHMGLDAVAEVRGVLEASGASEKVIRDVADILTGKVDEAGKASYLKRRLEIDMNGVLELPNGDTVRVGDMLDTNLNALMASYADDMSGRAALARVGLASTTDIDNLRAKYLELIPNASERRAHAALYDDAINVLLGKPTGEEMHMATRYVSMMTQMVGLAYGGFWQVTEYAKIMSKYTAVLGGQAVIGSIWNSFGQMKQFMKDPHNATSLQKILTRNATQDLRLQVFVNRMDDNRHIDSPSIALDMMGQAKQLVYTANGMRYVQTHQAMTAANLIVDTFERALRGEEAPLEHLRKYGLDDGLIRDANVELKKHGDNYQNWDSDVWYRVSDVLNRVIDVDVLRAKPGDIPAFAQRTAVGRVLFTFRSFVLSAHNKIFANTIHDQGLTGLALLLSYQIPLAMMMTQAASVSKGNGVIDDWGEWVDQAVAQSGGLGLFSEFIGILTGGKQQFGAPILISLDNAYRILNNLGQAEFGKAAKAAADTIPIISLLPGVRALTKAVFD